MTLESQPRILRLHPFSIVFHADRLLATQLDRDRDPPSAGVQSVLDQLLDRRDGPLDDLSGRNLVREIGR